MAMAMPLRFDILTLFPGLFESPFSATILARAVSRGLISINPHDIRRFATDKHHTVDDIPYGGGPGMVMKPEPIVAALEKVALSAKQPQSGVEGRLHRALPVEGAT